MAFGFVALALAGCGGDGVAVDAGAGDGGAIDAAPTLHQLASSGARLDVSMGPIVGTTNLATDVDLVAVHEDFYGVPWTAFAADAGAPQAWVDFQTSIAQQAHATGKDVFLSLAPLAGDRKSLAGDVVAGGTGFQVMRGWKPPCYDLDTSDGMALRAAYARYVDFMVGLFAPKFTNVAIEINEFHLQCPSVWNGMVALENDAYAAAKAAAPSVPAFPSIQIDALYGLLFCPSPMTTAQCYETEYAGLAGLERDRFAISTYPYAFIAGITTPADIPADWFVRAAARGNERWLIAETGWLGTNLVVTNASSTCQTALAETANLQSDYFDRVLADALQNDVEVIEWISNRDFLEAQVMTDCPCQYSPSWCNLLGTVRGTGTPAQQMSAEVGFKEFGTMGIRDYAGNPRQPLFDHFEAARATK